MTTVAARLYHDGKVAQEIDLSKPIPHITQPKDFIWIGLHEPDDGALKRVQDHFGLHPLAVEDALDPKHLPKVDVYGDHLFLVIRTPKLEGDRIVYGNTAIFMGRQFIITVRHGSERSHSPIRDQLEATPWLLKQGADYVLPTGVEVNRSGNGQPVITWNEEAGYSYILQRSDNLTTWTNVVSRSAVSTGDFSHTDTNTPVPARRYYRVKRSYP